MGWLLVLGLKECLVECATLCVKSEVIIGLFLHTRTAYAVDIRVSNFLFRFPSFAETKAQIRGPSEYIHSSSTLKLSCRVYLGPRGPDEDYARTAVIHWFHEQRLLSTRLANFPPYSFIWAYSFMNFE